MRVPGRRPVIRRDRYLSETVKGTDRPARREAEKVLAGLQAEVDGQRSAQSSVRLGFTLDEWLKTVEVEESTRDGYVGYIERTTRPALGTVPIAKLSTRTLETFYAELRRCRARCNGASHVCKPMAASAVRHVHAVISGALIAGRAVGLDRYQPGPRRCVPSASPAAARPAVAVRCSADRRRRVRC